MLLLWDAWTIEAREFMALVELLESTVFAGMVDKDMSTELAVLYAAELTWFVLIQKKLCAPTVGLVFLLFENVSSMCS